MRGVLRCWRGGDGRRTSRREIVLEMETRNLSDETAWSSCTSALLALRAYTTVIADSRPTALLAVLALTTVLAYCTPTALLADRALTTVRTSTTHLAPRALLHPVLAWPLCVRGSLPLRALLHPITITGLDPHLSLELSLSRDLGTDPLEVGAPPRRHPVPNPSPPAAPARKCQPRANFLAFSNCSDCLLTAALHQSLTGESHLARSLTKISHPSALAS